VPRRFAPALLTGLLSLGLPALAIVAFGVASRGPVHRPHTTLGRVAAPLPRWDAAAQASLALLRRVTVQEARRAIGALARCEGRAAGAAAAQRNRRYRHCALRGMARTGGFARANTQQLETLADTARPGRRCLTLLRELAGGTGALNAQVGTLMRSWTATPWRELLASSRSVRGMARFTLRLAGARRWRAACRATPAAPAAPRLVL
jgi:hypothetical protein